MVRFYQLFPISGCLNRFVPSSESFLGGGGFTRTSAGGDIERPVPTGGRATTGGEGPVEDALSESGARATRGSAALSV